MILCLMAMITAPLLLVVGIWIVIGLVGGFTVVACELIQKAGCPLMALMIIFYPITALIATGYAMYETRELPDSVFGGFCSTYCELIGGVWVNCSPKECLD